MSLGFYFLYHLFIDLLFYYTGRVVLIPFTKIIKIEEKEEATHDTKWKLLGLVYKIGEERYLATSGVQLLGFIFWIGVIFLIGYFKKGGFNSQVRHQ